MAIQDDFTIDYVDRKITYSTAFVDDRPPTGSGPYTVNELYSFLQDTFDEPAQMDDPIPMSAQTPTQYTIVNKWFIDDESMKALYGGSVQTGTGSADAWTYAASEGITQVRWVDAPAVAPDATDIGELWTGTSGATGKVLAVDTTKQVAWLRNNNATQFGLTDTVTGPTTDPNFVTQAISGFQSGNNIWANLFSVGSLQASTEIYVGQEDDYMGGTAYHTANPEQIRMEKIDEWWDADVDFATGSPNLLGGAGHFDLLVKTTEAGVAIDGSRLAVFARQFSKVYSHFELVGGVGNFVIPFASTGADLNAQDGPYTASFDARGGPDLVVGAVLINAAGAGTNAPLDRLRAVVTAVTGAAATTGTFDWYLIGENEPLTTTDRTLVQLADNDNLKVLGNLTSILDVQGAVTIQAPGLLNPGSGVVSITFANTQVDVDEDGNTEEYACTIDCATNPLAAVYKHVQYLTSRGNQDGTTPNTQDTLLDTAGAVDEAGEFYRAVGDVVLTASAEGGTGLAEGAYVTGQTSNATGVVISYEGSATGLTVLHQVKGTFQAAEAVWGDATNNITIGSVSNIVDNTAAPFGTFAGGRWFVARGVVLINVPDADANNWQTIDLTGTAVTPPTVRTITFAGLSANDRAVIFEVDTASGIDITKNQNGVASGGAQGASTFVLDTTIALDVPSTGWVRVVDTSEAASGTEYRFNYTDITTTAVTLDSTAGTGTGGLDGTAKVAGSSTTVLADVTTGKFTNFGTDGNLKIGMEIRDTVTNNFAVILRKIDNDSIETTPISAGTWATVNIWEANRVPVALAAADTCYFGYIDDVASGTSLAKLVKYVEVTEMLARARFSDPDIGGQRSLPFEQTGVQFTDANLTVTAILNDDTIAS